MTDTLTHLTITTGKVATSTRADIDDAVIADGWPELLADLDARYGARWR